MLRMISLKIVLQEKPALKIKRFEEWNMNVDCKYNSTLLEENSRSKDENQQQAQPTSDIGRPFLETPDKFRAR